MSNVLKLSHESQNILNKCEKVTLKSHIFMKFSKYDF